MTRRRSPSIVANPVLVGAVTALVTVVAVFLAYNANSGLPFVPSYHVRVVVPDAARLVPGNEVRIGGARVGQIERIEPQALRDGRVRAVLSLRLEDRYGPLPRDTVASIRQRSTLGLKYLELRPGRSAATVREGETWAPPTEDVVELDDALDTFDAPTRSATRGALRELSDGLAGRGWDLNRTLAALPRVTGRLRPVMATLASSDTDLAGFVDGAALAASAVRPVADPLAGLFDGAADTLSAVRAERSALAATLDEAPRVEATGARAFAAARPFLADTERLVAGLRPAVRALPDEAPPIARGLRDGTPVLRRTPPLARRLERTLGGVERLARLPATAGALRKLTATVGTLRPALQFILPFQTTCNYLGVWFRNLASAISEGDRGGHWFRFSAVVKPELELQTDRPMAELHYNPYPDQGQDGECEAGNEPYLPGQVIGRVPGRQPARTELTSRPEGVPEGP